MKKEFFVIMIIVTLLLVNSIYALSPCKSGSLTTSVHKNYQMLYTDENFIQLDNTGLLADVSQLKDLTCLQYLDATDKNIKGDVSNLKNLVNLEVLSLYSNLDVSGDICSLKDAVKLRSLKFAFNPKITGDVSCLKSLTKLETFAMTHTQISGDLSVFSNMKNLKAIYVSGTNIKGDICALKDLINLEELGIADEYPGNPDITGDLSCLDNLKKLKKVSIYNTNTVNCEQFTKSHPSIQGGCSKESIKTLTDSNKKYERKIGKEVQTEVRGKSDYQPALSENFLTKFFGWIKNLFKGKKAKVEDAKTEDTNQIIPSDGPGNCKTQDECKDYCSKPENKEKCLKFNSPNYPNTGGEEVRPDLEKGGPGGCKTQKECQDYCSKNKDDKECSELASSKGK